MSEQVYNPFEDNDIILPAYKKDGSNLVLPFFICGVKIKDVTSNRTGDNLQVIELAFEVDERGTKKMDPISIFYEDEEGRYMYNGKVKEEVPADTFAGKRVKGGKRVTLWRNLSRSSNRTNRNYLDILGQMGIEIKHKKVKYEGKNVEMPIIPEPSVELFLGVPVFGWMDEESFTDRNGNHIRYNVVNKVVKIENMDRVEVLENSLSDNNQQSSPSSKEDDPFGDMDDDLPF